MKMLNYLPLTAGSFWLLAWTLPFNSNPLYFMMGALGFFLGLVISTFAVLEIFKLKYPLSWLLRSYHYKIIDPTFNRESWLREMRKRKNRVKTHD